MCIRDSSDSDPESSSSSQGAANIMRQLPASDSQGVERKREVVVRPDGSKVIRVEKRRRTYNADHGDAKQAVLKNKRFLIGLCILVLLVVGALAGTYMYRLPSFPSLISSISLLPGRYSGCAATQSDASFI